MSEWEPSEEDQKLMGDVLAHELGLLTTEEEWELLKRLAIRKPIVCTEWLVKLGWLTQEEGKQLIVALRMKGYS